MVESEEELNGRNKLESENKYHPKTELVEHGIRAKPIELETIELGIMSPKDDGGKIARLNHYKVAVSCVFFGLGSWLPVTALYSQMPLLVHYAPERLALPSYLIVVVQIANLVPALYSYFRKRLENVRNDLISVFLILGTVSLAASAFSYDVTFEIFEYEHSVCFFVISLLCSSVGCVSPVLFLPFLNEVPERYLPPYFAGVSSSGLIPSALALIQGIKRMQCKNSTHSDISVRITMKEEEPLFGSRVFFLVSSVLMLLSTIAFLYLKRYSETNCNGQANDDKAIAIRDSNPTISRRLYLYLMVLQAAVNGFQNGILMSIQSYSCARYGIEAYHWSVNLNQMVGPLIMYLCSFISLLSLSRLMIACILFVVCVVYEISTALVDEPPPFVEYRYFGPIHIVLVWVFGSGLISFVKLSTAAILRRYNKKALFYYGAMTQLGSAGGAAVSFLLINYTNIFRPKVMKMC